LREPFIIIRSLLVDYFSICWQQRAFPNVYPILIREFSSQILLGPIQICRRDVFEFAFMNKRQRSGGWKFSSNPNEQSQ
jgi:hypothetical protein